MGPIESLAEYGRCVCLVCLVWHFAGGVYSMIIYINLLNRFSEFVFRMLTCFFVIFGYFSHMALKEYYQWEQFESIQRLPQIVPLSI
jgi:hypothetical protein